ncbi:CDP-glucose 4,6-dehydratase [Fluviispira sanaruensis]|uniref:CDP-glucose 4,6-dehydratase n=1 Tax=Fluviispira sanaruensis TaxID=2493639 RepID=A0A4P2VPF7_FLUSA|nr:CDP-glucose 4,6-dehydratase [Fluviispira sanaruensis]BBH54060.1 CDP-glucose 4,6-dehydratase [Fluviispira sanaruensis]
MLIYNNLFLNTYKDKKVFVTGHTGFKGAWLTQWLLELGADVAGYSLYIPSQPSLYEILNLKEKIKIDFQADILEYNVLKSALNEFQPDIVFHLAAQPIVSESYNHPRNTFQVNLMGMVNILDAILAIPSVRAGVFITSDKCYDNVEWEFGYRESDKLGGKDPYSASKACAEIAFSSYVRSFYNSSDLNIPFFSTTRAGNVIGGGDWAKDRIVPDCMRAWSQLRSVSIRNPNSTRPWQHVLEPLSGYLWLGANLFSKKEGTHGEAFNFGPSSEVNYFVEVLINLLQRDWENASLETVKSDHSMNLKEASLLKLCCDKAYNRLGWLPTLSFNETALFTSSWYKNYYSNQYNIEEFTKKQIEQYCEISSERKRIWTR